MARMFDNDKSSSSDYGDSLKLTNWILDSGAMCHMTPQVSYFIPSLLEDMDKHIEDADGNHQIAKFQNPPKDTQETTNTSTL